jgi:hypothetical protein
VRLFLISQKREGPPHPTNKGRAWKNIIIARRRFGLRSDLKIQRKKVVPVPYKSVVGVVVGGFVD